MLFALTAFYHRPAAHVLDKGVAHISNGSVSVHTNFRLHFRNAVLYHFKLVGVKLKLFGNSRVSFNKLCGTETSAKTCIVGVVFNNVAYRVDTSVNSTAAVIYLSGLYALFSGIHSRFDKLLNTVILCGGYGHNGYAYPFGKLGDIYGAAVISHLVHHIESQHHRYFQLAELKRQIQTSLNIGCVNYVYDTVRLFVYQKISCNYLLNSIRTDRVYSREINNCAVLVSFYLTAFLLNRNSWKISHVLI